MGSNCLDESKSESRYSLQNKVTHAKIYEKSC